jgi:hypothetical protein
MERVLSRVKYQIKRGRGKAYWGIAAVSAGLSAVLCATAAPTASAAVSTAARGAAGRPAYQLPPGIEPACPWPAGSGEAACFLLANTNISAGARQPDRISQGSRPATADPPDGYGPADLQSAYNLASAAAKDGKGETVALVDAGDDPTAESDLAFYRASYDLPPCTTANGCFSKVNEEGQEDNYPAVDDGWATEESLDIDMVSAICPLCHILLVEASSQAVTDLGASNDEAVTLGAKFVSNSWGAAESGTELRYDHYFNHPGAAITASSGDSGHLGAWPAASPYVTAVGGTSLLPASKPRGWDEIAWSGAGSWCSNEEPKPAWQHDAGCSMRTVTDVSAVADPETGLAVYDTTPNTFGVSPGWLVVGGTSAASPIIASVYALAGTPKPGTNPAEDPYAAPGDLNDIVAGQNSFPSCTPTYICTAGPGYDGPTGLGTPDGTGAFG